MDVLQDIAWTDFRSLLDFSRSLDYPGIGQSILISMKSSRQPYVPVTDQKPRSFQLLSKWRVIPALRIRHAYRLCGEIGQGDGT